MTLKKKLVFLAIASTASFPVFAQSNTASDVQRDVNQQQRVESGLQSGQLNTREAGELEHQEAHVDNLQKRAEKNGSISASEQSRINAAQNHVSQDIHAAKSNDIHGNPYSNSSQRMQGDVQRDVNQQQRTENGIKNGSLTHREVGQVEHGEARDANAQAKAAANGRVGAGEQKNLQARESRESARIHNQKHDRQHHA